MRRAFIVSLCSITAVAIAAVEQNPPQVNPQTSAVARPQNQEPPRTQPEIDWWARITNGLIAIGTLGLAGVGYWAARIALGTLNSIKAQAEVMTRELEISHRAYLALGEPTKIASGVFRFPIQNYGHIAGTIKNVMVEVIIQDAAGAGLFHEDKSKPVDMLITPRKDESESISVTLPAQLPRAYYHVVNIELEYRYGFGDKSDTYRLTKVFCGHLDSMRAQWAQAYGVEEFNFSPKESDSKPTV